MSIITKSGDDGKTSLYSGERVYKDDLRVEAYGTLDELNAWIGECRNHLANPVDKENLLEIQKNLFRCMGQLATKKELLQKRLRKRMWIILRSLFIPWKKNCT